MNATIKLTPPPQSLVDAITPIMDWVPEPQQLQPKPSTQLIDFLLNPASSTEQSKEIHQTTSIIDQCFLTYMHHPHDITSQLQCNQSWHRFVSLSLKNTTWCHALCYLTPNVVAAMDQHLLLGQYLTKHHYQRNILGFSLNQHHQVIRKSLWKHPSLPNIPLLECITYSLSDI